MWVHAVCYGFRPFRSNVPNYFLCRVCHPPELEVFFFFFKLSFDFVLDEKLQQMLESDRDKFGYTPDTKRRKINNTEEYTLSPQEVLKKKKKKKKKKNSSQKISSFQRDSFHNYWIEYINICIDESADEEDKEIFVRAVSKLFAVPHFYILFHFTLIAEDILSVDLERKPINKTYLSHEDWVLRKDNQFAKLCVDSRTHLDYVDFDAKYSDLEYAISAVHAHPYNQNRELEDQRFESKCIIKCKNCSWSATVESTKKKKEFAVTEFDAHECKASRSSDSLNCCKEESACCCLSTSKSCYCVLHDLECNQTKDGEQCSFCYCSGDCKNQGITKGKEIKKELVGIFEGDWKYIAKENVDVGNFVTEVVGKVTSFSVVRKTEWKDPLFQDSRGIILKDQDLFWNQRKAGNDSRFIRKSCEPNAVVKLRWVDDTLRVAVYAGEEGIDSGEEVTLAWDREFKNLSCHAHCACQNCEVFQWYKDMQRCFKLIQREWGQGERSQLIKGTDKIVF